jgi:integrase
MDEKLNKGSGKSNQSRHPRIAKSRSSKGLKLVNRGGIFYINGTTRVQGRSVRVRKSTGLTVTPSNRKVAMEELEELRAEIRRQVLNPRNNSQAVSLACQSYINRPRKSPLGQTSVNIILEINDRFSTRLFNDIEPMEWITWIDKRHEGNAASARERFISTVDALIKWAAKKPRYWVDQDHIPEFERDKQARNPNTRTRRRVGEITPQLVELMVEHAAPHLKGQIAAEWATGGRVSSILHGCRVCDLVLAPGAESLTFHGTKNDTSVDAALDAWSAQILRDYMKWRGNWHKRTDALFVTRNKKPYKDTGGVYGDQNKTAWKTMKKRVRKALWREAATLRADGRKEEAAAKWAEASLMAEVTQHWFRHMLATDMLSATNNSDIRSVMAQGGWKDPRSVIGYTHDVPERRREIVNSRPMPKINERRKG